VSDLPDYIDKVGGGVNEAVCSLCGAAWSPREWEQTVNHDCRDDAEAGGGER